MYLIVTITNIKVRPTPLFIHSYCQ